MAQKCHFSQAVRELTAAVEGRWDFRPQVRNRIFCHAVSF